MWKDLRGPDILFAYWVILQASLSSVDFYFKQAFLSSVDFFIFFLNKLFQTNLSGIPSECQTVWIKIRPDILPGLTWVQTVCKGYQQTTKVATSRERVNKGSNIWLPVWFPVHWATSEKDSTLKGKSKCFSSRIIIFRREADRLQQLSPLKVYLSPWFCANIAINTLTKQIFRVFMIKFTNNKIQ